MRKFLFFISRSAFFFFAHGYKLNIYWLWLTVQYLWAKRNALQSIFFLCTNEKEFLWFIDVCNFAVIGRPKRENNIFFLSSSSIGFHLKTKERICVRNGRHVSHEWYSHSVTTVHAGLTVYLHRTKMVIGDFLPDAIIILA